MTEESVTQTEKMMVIAIFGGLAFMMAWKGNTEAAVGFASVISTYFLSRSGT